MLLTWLAPCLPCFAPAQPARPKISRPVAVLRPVSVQPGPRVAPQPPVHPTPDAPQNTWGSGSSKYSTYFG